MWEIVLEDSSVVVWLLLALAALTYYLTRYTGRFATVRWGTWNSTYLRYLGTDLVCVFRESTYDLDKIPGPWKQGLPILGNLLSLLSPDHHKTLLKWTDDYGGIFRYLHTLRSLLNDCFSESGFCGKIFLS